MNNLQMKHEIDGQFTVIFETNQNEVTDENEYLVIYGSENKEFTELEDALSYYSGCMYHQMECAGLKDSF